MTSATHTPEASEAARVTGNEAWASVSRTIAGMLVYGGIGYAIGAWTGHPQAGLAIGVLLGAALGLYLSVTSINGLGGRSQQRLAVSESRSWSARMTRARMDRSSEESDGD